MLWGNVEMILDPSTTFLIQKKKPGHDENTRKPVFRGWRMHGLETKWSSREKGGSTAGELAWDERRVGPLTSLRDVCPSFECINKGQEEKGSKMGKEGGGDVLYNSSKNIPTSRSSRSRLFCRILSCICCWLLGLDWCYLNLCFLWWRLLWWRLRILNRLNWWLSRDLWGSEAWEKGEGDGKTPRHEKGGQGATQPRRGGRQRVGQVLDSGVVPWGLWEEAEGKLHAQPGVKPGDEEGTYVGCSQGTFISIRFESCLT